MISNQITAGNQMLCTRWTCTTEAKVIILPEPALSRDFCICDYSIAPCTYFELALTDILNTSDKYLNDYRKFLLNPLSATSSFSFVLIEKDGTEHVIYSDTESTTDFGAIFTQGLNESQPLQVGVNILWWKVVNTLGYGDYTVKLSQTDFGNELTNTTHVFRVVKYNALRANGTIKIEVENVGVTMNGKNWTGLLTDSNSVFTNMIRLNGRMLLTDPEIEIESIEDGSRTTRPVQTKLTDTYSMTLDRVPFDIGRALVHEDILMNWKVTDYNVLNEDLRDEEMIIQGSSGIIVLEYTRKSYELTAKSNVSKLNRKFI